MRSGGAGVNLEGTYTALVTPFRDGVLDEAAFRRLVRRQLDAGIDGLVPCGTTGETPTLSDQEYVRVVTIAVEEAGGAVPVIAGTGSNCTEKTIALTRLAKSLGVDAALVVTPYYNKPQQHGLVAHFKALTEAVDLPVVLYNVPGRTACNMSPEVAATLSELPLVVALKDAAGSAPQTMRTLQLCGDRLNLLSGDDAVAFNLYCLGGKGVISVVSNVAPQQMKAIYDHVRAGDLAAARKAHFRLLPLIDAVFVESNPVPTKAALSFMGLCSDEVRLPLVPHAEIHHAALKSHLRDLDLLT